jgi:hypothetical protein
MSDYQIDEAAETADLSFMSEPDAAFPTTALDEVMKGVNLLRTVRERIIRMELKVAEVKAAEDKLSKEIIPALLDAHHVTTITLDNKGEPVTVTVKEDVKASVPEDVVRRANGLKWLTEKGAGALIADTLTLEDPTEELIQFMQEKGISYQRDRTVTGNRLAAWFREKFGIKKGTVATMEKAEVSPDISCYRYRKTEIK